MPKNNTVKVMCKKLKFENDDLLGSNLPTQTDTLFNLPIDGFDNSVSGNYSFFNKSKIFIWEGNLQTNSEILMSFCPSVKPSYFYLLNFESNRNLNTRITVNLPISATLLDNQSQKGSLFWLSNVGIELMVPAGTQIHFQLIVIPQNIFFNYVKDLFSTQLKMPFFSKKHNIPIFYFSNIYCTFQNLLFNLKKIKNVEDRIVYTMSLMTTYLLKANEGFSTQKVSLKDFYNMLLIEKVIKLLPAMREPNIDLLSDDFHYSSKKLNRLFLEVFGVSIVEYHRGFHMRYAKLLIEEKQMKIDEVSKELGFRTTNLFSQVFKRHYFYMPQKYKPKRE